MRVFVCGVSRVHILVRMLIACMMLFDSSFRVYLAGKFRLILMNRWERKIRT